MIFLSEVVYLWMKTNLCCYILWFVNKKTYKYVPVYESCETLAAQNLNMVEFHFL